MSAQYWIILFWLTFAAFVLSSIRHRAYRKMSKTSIALGMCGMYKLGSQFRDSIEASITGDSRLQFIYRPDSTGETAFALGIDIDKFPGHAWRVPDVVTNWMLRVIPCALQDLGTVSASLPKGVEMELQKTNIVGTKPKPPTET